MAFPNARVRSGQLYIAKPEISAQHCELEELNLRD